MIDALASGSHERAQGFTAFYDSAYDRVARLAYLLTGSLAVGEELAQDAFVQLYQRWDDVREPGAWVRAAVVSGSRSWWRKARRPHPAYDAPLLADHADALAVRGALAALPLKYRTALVLRFFEDLPERDIAEAMDCPVGTVKSLIHRGLQRMTEDLR
jgi:RNA polymerase sigma-70 factor (sigma-E family)